MNIIFNQYSYLTFTVLGTLLLLFILWRSRVRWWRIGLVGLALAVAIAAGWLVLRPGSSDVDSVAAAEQVLSSGKPTLIEFYSNYCVGCMAVRAAVDDLVAQSDERFGDDLSVLRIDIHTDLGRALRERYGFSYSPEFVLFNHAGAEVWRSHQPPTLGDLESVVRADAVGTSG